MISLGRKLPKRAARWLLLLISLALSIVLIEGLLRLVAVSMPAPPLYPGDREAVRDATYDAVLGWKLEPSATYRETKPDYSVAYRSNSQGFRADREFSPDLGDERIVFLGDSFTFGSGVELEETFVARIEALRPGLVAFNLGIGGFGIDQMWLALVHHGLALDPTQAVLSFIREDLDRSLSAYRQGHVWLEKPLFALVDGELVRMTSENRPGALRSWLTQSVRWTGLWRRVENSLSRNFAVGYRWRLNRALFEEIRDTCRAADVPLLVVYLPVNRRHPAPVLEREFLEMSIDFLDLTPLLPADAESLYFPEDRHFNPAGHRFAAEAIAAALGDPPG